MRAAWWPLGIGALLAISLVLAVVRGDRQLWIIVALLALSLALELWRRP